MTEMDNDFTRHDDVDGSAADENDDVVEMNYKIDDVPPWYTTIILGFQHYFTMMGATVSVPLILAPALCIGNDMVATSEILCTLFFVAGIVTLCQSTVGVRLPIIQGSTFTFLVSSLAILSQDEWKCPVPDGNINSNSSYNRSDDDGEIWKSRMRELQGAIIIASLFEVVAGLTGIVGLILRFIGPLTIAPFISLIGLSLFGAASDRCSTNWWMAFFTMLLITICSQYLRHCDVPIVVRKGGKCTTTRYPLFSLFPVVIGVGISWILCAILTVTDAIPDDETHWAYLTRTDVKSDVIASAPWFRFPYPFQWGWPTFSAASILGMLAAVIAGMIESIGDYYACARLCGAPPPPVHAINRGILTEGLGCVLNGIMGTGSGTTSYSENVGAIGLTKVASRRVIQCSAIIMIILGLIGKFGSVFVTIPDPVIGGVFMVSFGLIVAVGVSSLQFVNLNSTRNLFIFGVPVLLGLSLPNWLNAHPDAIQTGEPTVDQIISVLGKTSVFVGGVTALILDNTVPGTDDERGITKWRKQIGVVNIHLPSSQVREKSTYDLPLCTDILSTWKWTKFVPICPAFDGFHLRRRTKENVTISNSIITSNDSKSVTEKSNGNQDYLEQTEDIFITKI